MAHILVLDDEPTLLGLVSATLQGAGHTVTPMSDPLAAVEAVGSGSLAIDLLLADVTLGPISGLEVMKRLIALGFSGPIVLMSGYSGLSAAISQTMGARAVVEKPFTATELRNAVSMALSRSQTRPPRVA
jgi:CheY-like chemotaxis protein